MQHTGANIVVQALSSLRGSLLRRSLYQKIIGLVVLILLCAGAIIMLTSLRKAAQDQRDIAYIARIHLLTARLHEKDFLTRKKLALADVTIASLVSMDSLLLKSESKQKDTLLELSAQFRSAFKGLVERLKMRGLDENSGVEGAFRQRVHAVESATKAANQQRLLADMYLCRRHEKDFVNRGSDKYVASLHQAVDVFLRDIEALPAGEQAALKENILNYAQGFDEYVAITKQIAVQTALLAELTAKMEPIFDAIVLERSLAADRYDAIATWGTAALCVLAVAIGLVLARRISQPVVELTSAALRFARGETQIVVDIRTGDEIQQLAEAFNAMVDNTKRSMQLIQEAGDEAYRSAQEAERQRALVLANQHALAQSIQKMLFAMGEFSFGNLTVKLQLTGNDAIDKLFVGFNDVVANIRSLTVKILDVVQAVASVTERIEQHTRVMAASMDTQQVQTAEIFSTLASVNQAIETNAAHAGRAADDAAEVSSAALHGGEAMQTTLMNVGRIAQVVQETAAKVRALGEASMEISAVATVIDEIADQTNLLALNAAIEAARAGNAGRGFAVVADEVRKLAERTQRATKEIATMINSIQSNTREVVRAMEQGASIAKHSEHNAAQTSSALAAVIEKTTAVAEVVQQLAAVSKTQAESSRSITGNVEAIHTITQQTAAIAGEMAMISSELQELTRNLQIVVGRFIVDENQV
jgi:methyl-accepting chemotaxis protein